MLGNRALGFAQALGPGPELKRVLCCGESLYQPRALVVMKLRDCWTLTLILVVLHVTAPSVERLKHEMGIDHV